MSNLFSKIFSPNDREVTKARKLVEMINSFEPAVEKLSDKELLASSEYFRNKLSIDIEQRKSADIYYDVDYPTIDKKKLDAERKVLLDLLPKYLLEYVKQQKE